MAPVSGVRPAVACAGISSLWEARRGSWIHSLAGSLPAPAAWAGHLPASSRELPGAGLIPTSPEPAYLPHLVSPAFQPVHLGGSGPWGKPLPGTLGLAPSAWRWWHVCLGEVSEAPPPPATPRGARGRAEVSLLSSFEYYSTNMNTHRCQAAVHKSDQSLCPWSRLPAGGGRQQTQKIHAF